MYITRKVRLTKNCNKELVGLETLSDKDIAKLKEMLENHVKYTGSDVAENMLNNWSEEVKNFVKVIPNDYKKVITVLDEELEKEQTEMRQCLLHLKM